MRSSLVAGAIMIAVFASASHAQTSCEATFASSGNLLSGRSFSSWQEFASPPQRILQAAEAFVGTHGKNVQSLTNDGRVLRFSQGTSRERAAQSEVTVAPAAGGAHRVTLTNRFPGAQVVVGSTVRDFNCRFFAYLAESLAGTAAAGPLTPTRPRGAGDTVPASAGWGERVRYDFPQGGGERRFLLREARAGDTLVMMSFGAPASELSSAGVHVVVRDVGGRRTLAAVPPGAPVPLHGTGPFEILAEPNRDMPGRGFDLSFVRISGGPEHAPRVLRVGARIEERIDAPRDMDEYVVRAQAGQELDIVLEGAGEQLVVVGLYSGYEQGPIGPIRGQGVERLGRIYRIPADGEYYVIVEDLSSSGTLPDDARYTLLLRERT